jgi:hypothetical protein
MSNEIVMNELKILSVVRRYKGLFTEGSGKNRELEIRQKERERQGKQ